MEIISHQAFDIKYIRESDINYNPALGTGQLQVKDINYVKLTPRTTADFCQLLDKKFIASRGQPAFNKLATKSGWLEGTTDPQTIRESGHED